MQRRVKQTILSKPEITACIGQGQQWSGNGTPWPLRETRFGHSGNLSSLHHGSGMDYSETRAYQAGDDPRHINWRATARTGQPQVRVFHQDLAPASYFIVDQRSSMRFGTRKRLKATQAARLAIFLASWESRTGAELGTLLLNESLHWQPPVSGFEGISRLATLISQPCPPLFKPPVESIKQTLRWLLENTPAGSHLYLFSDLYDLDADQLSLLYQLGEQHIVWFIHIFDPAEEALPSAGTLQLVWNRTSAHLSTQTTEQPNTIIDTENIANREQLQENFQSRQQQLEKLCKRAGIYYTSISSGEDDISKSLQAM